MTRSGSFACHAICTLSPLHPALTTRFAKNTQEHTSKVLYLPRKTMMEVPKVLRLPGEMRLIFWKPSESIVLVTQNDIRHFCRHVKMSRSATPATQNGIRTCSKMRGFAASPIDTATPQEHQSMKTRHVGNSEPAFRARLPEFFTLCSFKISVFRWVFSWTSKFATSKSMSCEASINLQHTS